MGVRAGEAVALVAATTAAILLGVSVVRVAGDPFGDSHDGRNGAVWARASAALRSDPIGSRLGAQHEGGVYANHPPLIAVETAVAEAIFGVQRSATRAPAWVGSIVAVGLSGFALRRLGVSRQATLLGVALGTSSPLFLSYMAMLDTPVTSLVFGVALLAVWVSAGDRPSRRRLLATMACAGACALAGWQGLLFAGLLGVGSWANRRRVAVAVAAGAASGAGLVIAHQLWVWGSLTELWHQLGNRSTVGSTDDHSVTWAEGLQRQVEWFVDLVNPVALILGIAGVVLLVRDGGDRRTVAVTTSAAVLLYDVLLSGGAAFHDYWSYWSVLPLVLGSARAIEWMRASALRRRPAATAALIGAILVLTAVALVDDDVRTAQDRGTAAARLAQRAPSADVRALAMATPTVWLPYERGHGADSDTVRCVTGACLVLLDIEAAEHLGWDLTRVRVVDRTPPYALVEPSDIRRLLRPGAPG